VRFVRLSNNAIPSDDIGCKVSRALIPFASSAVVASSATMMCDELRHLLS